MTDGRDVPRKDEGRLGLGSLDVGVKRAQLPSGCEICESLFGVLIGCVRLRSARTNFSCSLKLRRAREDGAKILRSGPEGVEKGASRVLAWSGVGRLVPFGALGDPRISFHLTILYIYARTNASVGSISHGA
jgi:hypothetical protein